VSLSGPLLSVEVVTGNGVTQKADLAADAAD